MRQRKIGKPLTELGEYIEKAGYGTQAEFAERAGIMPSTMSLIANKRVLPIRQHMALICTLLDISPLQVWEAYELDLLGSLKQTRGAKRRARLKRWRIECNLGRELFRALKKELKRQGKTWQLWIMEKAMEEIEKCQQS